MVPFPKALVLLGSLADGVDDGAISLPLISRLSPLALQLLGAVDLIVHVGFLNAARERVALTGFAADNVIKFSSRAIKQLLGFSGDGIANGSWAASTLGDLIFEVLMNPEAINPLPFWQGLGIAQQIQL